MDKIDWEPLNELPAVPVEEATADYLMASLPFLTLYTPSGNNYHIFTTGTNASIGKSSFRKSFSGVETEANFAKMFVQPNKFYIP